MDGDGKGGRSGNEEGTVKRMMRKTAKKTSHTPKGSANVIKFCAILEALPMNLRFELTNISKDFDGSWEKTVLNGTTAWENGPRILFNSSFFPKRNQVLEAIEREGWQVKKLYFPDTNSKIASLLTKEKVKELYYKKSKSLQDIAKEYGCTRQWIFLLMEEYGLKRRTLSEAIKEGMKQGKG